MNNLHNPVLTKKLEEIGLLSLLADESITDIAINDASGNIWVERETWQKIHTPNATLENLEQLGQLIANINNLRLHNEEPVLSAQLPTGERVQISISPAVAANSFSMVIRRYSSKIKSLDELIEQGTFDNYTWVKKTNFTDEIKEQLSTTNKELVEYLQTGNIKDFLKFAILNKQNLIVAGATGSGKTFFTRSLIQEVPFTERIITIEDVHELFLPNHENKVHKFFGNGKERVTAKKALEGAMREKPDRIFLAEVRGDEAWDYLSSLNNGHPGSITSVHSNDAYSTYNRLTNLIKGSAVGLTLEREYIMSQVLSTIHISLYFAKRKMTQIFFDPVFANQGDYL
jgi:type IV secretion system protein VirB11